MYLFLVSLAIAMMVAVAVFASVRRAKRLRFLTGLALAGAFFLLAPSISQATYPRTIIVGPRFQAFPSVSYYSSGYASYPTIPAEFVDPAALYGAYSYEPSVTISQFGGRIITVPAAVGPAYYSGRTFFIDRFGRVVYR